MNAEYTLAQASAITGLPLSAVHKAIDNRLIRPRLARSGRSVKRLLSAKQLVYLCVEAKGVYLFPLAARRRIARTVTADADVDSMTVTEGGVVAIQIKTARRQVAGQLRRLEKAERSVISDPEIMRGTPVFRGTRIPVELIAAMLAQGASVAEILEGYPALTREKIAMAPLYVRAFPRRGRPAAPPWLKKPSTHQ